MSPSLFRVGQKVRANAEAIRRWGKSHSGEKIVIGISASRNLVLLDRCGCGKNHVSVIDGKTGTWWEVQFLEPVPEEPVTPEEAAQAKPLPSAEEVARFMGVKL